MSWAATVKLTNSIYGPGIYLKDHKLDHFYKENPRGAPLLMGGLGALEGVVSVFLFPITSLINALVLAIIGLYRVVNHKEGAGKMFKASALCFTSFTTSVIFFAICAYYFPLSWSAMAYILVVTVSIVIHTYKMVKAPTKNDENQL